MPCANTLQAKPTHKPVLTLNPHLFSAPTAKLCVADLLAHRTAAETATPTSCNRLNPTHSLTLQSHTHTRRNKGGEATSTAQPTHHSCSTAAHTPATSADTHMTALQINSHTSPLGSNQPPSHRQKPTPNILPPETALYSKNPDTLDRNQTHRMIENARTHKQLSSSSTAHTKNPRGSRYNKQLGCERHDAVDRHNKHNTKHKVVPMAPRLHTA